MKHRIIKDGPNFIPQYKRFLLWNNFYWKRQFLGFTYSYKDQFSSLEGARRFLDNKLNENTTKKKIEIYPH